MHFGPDAGDLLPPRQPRRDGRPACPARLLRHLDTPAEARERGLVLTTLFERTSRRVNPTEAGHAIAARARRVLAEVDAARQEVDELRGVLRGRIWIGALLPAGDLDVPGLLARFSQAHPGVEVGLREGIAGDMLRFLAADTSAVEKLFADAGERLRPSLESGDPFLLRSLAARGFATAILPRSLTAMEGPAIEVRSLHPAIRLPVALVWRRERNAPPAARTFIDFVRRETAHAG